MSAARALRQKSARLGLGLLLAAAGGVMQAQTPATPPQPPQPGIPATETIQMPAMPRVVLTAGRSTVLPTEFNITRIAVTNPAIADAVVVTPREILIDGKAPGTISLI